MSRGTSSTRRWVKLFPERCLNGSIRYQLTSEQRGVWYDLIMFASTCGHEGIIADTDGRALPREFIANRLNIKLECLNETIKLCEAEGRIQVNGAGALIITNWKEYQSEYERQKPYRKKAKDDPDKYLEGPYGHMVQR